MPFQDLFKKQFNNLGDELQELHQRLLPLYDPDLVNWFVENPENKILPQLDSKLSDLVQHSAEELKALLLGRDSDQMENFELLADLFAAISKKQGFEAAAVYRDKAKEMYQFITAQTATFSFERNAKIMGL